MNSSFPNGWSFSYLKFTKYVTNIIAESKYKYGQQEQVTVRNHNGSTGLERSVLKCCVCVCGGGGLNRFCGYPTKTVYIVVTNSENQNQVLVIRPNDNHSPGPVIRESKKISNDQELIQSDPTSCPQNQKGNN